MSDVLPLANAQRRLGRRGRPPLDPAERERRATARDAMRAARIASIAPRLLDVGGAASYLGLRPGTIRGLIDAGTLKRVTIPAGDRDLRVIRLDVRDLDRLIEGWKE